MNASKEECRKALAFVEGLCSRFVPASQETVDGFLSLIEFLRRVEAKLPYESTVASARARSRALKSPYRAVGVAPPRGARKKSPNSALRS
jgi:hypothetical protein